MRTFALIGKTGTGKSFHALDISQENKIDAIIDDGLLIFESKILAGRSAKHEKTRVASVKRAIFDDLDHALSVRNALRDNPIGSVLIIGTSEKMVNEIAKKLHLPPFEKTFKIEDIATPEEIDIASVMRNKFGKHIIPVPVFEVKKQFSGYFLNSIFSKGLKGAKSEKTVMRPTYSYLGNFIISPKVFIDICNYEVSKIEGVFSVGKIKSSFDQNGYISLDVDVSLDFPCDIPKTAESIQKAVSESIENSTSMVVEGVNVFIKALRMH